MNRIHRTHGAGNSNYQITSNPERSNSCRRKRRQALYFWEEVRGSLCRSLASERRKQRIPPCVLFFFFSPHLWHPEVLWGKGSNLCHSSDNAGSLTRYTTRELPCVLFNPWVREGPGCSGSLCYSIFCSWMRSPSSQSQSAEAGITTGLYQSLAVCGDGGKRMAGLV